MTILDIPYVSQEDEGATIGAKEIYNDCGPTCGVMLIRAYTPDKTFTVDQFYKELGYKKDVNIKYDQLQKVLDQHGISSKRRSGLNKSHLESLIKEKRPPIVLFNYKVLRKNGINTYNKSARFHWAVLVGIDESSVYLNDPLWPGTGGKNFQIPLDIWLEAWGGKSFYNDKKPPELLNQEFQAVIPNDPLDVEEMKLPEGSLRMKVIYDKFMNVRSGPDIKNKKLGEIKPGAYLTILKTQASGEDVWGHLGGNRWIAIYLDGFTYLEPAAPAVESHEDKSTITKKEELREEIKMSNKQKVNSGQKSKDGMPETADQTPSLSVIMAELKEIKAMLTEMKKNMASGNLEIKGQPKDVQVPDETVTKAPDEPKIPDEPEKPEDKYIEVKVFTTKKNKQVYLSYIKGYNNDDMPKFQFYPGDSAKVSERVFVKSGEKLKVIPDSQMVGDGGDVAWKLDMNEYIPRMKRSARIPSGVQLVIMEKFIKK